MLGDTKLNDISLMTIGRMTNCSKLKRRDLTCLTKDRFANVIGYFNLSNIS